MTTLNRSTPDYTPQDEPLYAIPVQEGSVQNLCPAITPDGQGLLGWIDELENDYRIAVVPDFPDIFENDVVAPANIRVVWDDFPYIIWTGSIWVWEGLLYAFISSRLNDGTRGKIECFVANNVENPTSWTLVGTVQDLTTGPTAIGLTVRQCGIPTVLPNGYWVLPCHCWLSYVGTLADGLGLFVSEDEGATWAMYVSYRRGPGLSGTAGPQSTTVGFRPDDGNLWFGAREGPVGQWRAYYAPNPDGTAWSVSAQSAPIPILYNPHYYIDNGTDLFASNLGDDAMRIYRVVDPEDPSTWIDLGMRGIVTDTITAADGFQIVPFWADTNYLGLAFTAKDRIAYHPACRPTPPPPLRIPYKERLDNLARDLTDAGIARAIDQQFQNLKVIENWSREWMSLASSPDFCTLFIPHKAHSSLGQQQSAAQSFENWKVIERWADMVAGDGCGCGCTGASDPPERCRLRIPYKDCLGTAANPLDLLSPTDLRTAADREFQAFKTFEDWANRYARGECGCAM